MDNWKSEREQDPNQILWITWTGVLLQLKAVHAHCGHRGLILTSVTYLSPLALPKCSPKVPSLKKFRICRSFKGHRVPSLPHDYISMVCLCNSYKLKPNSESQERRPILHSASLNFKTFLFMLTKLLTKYPKQAFFTYHFSILFERKKLNRKRYHLE